MNNNQTKRQFGSQRRQLDREILKASQEELKAQDWKKIQNIFFREKDNWFWSLTISTYLNVEKTLISLQAKPMNVDPLLWDILSIPENRKAPLSLRANGAFTCSSLPVAELSIDDGNLSAEQVSQKILSWLLCNFDEWSNKVSSCTFSSQLEKHENQILRGAYAISLITSLIAERDFIRAKDYSEKYGGGELESVFEMTCEGKSFYQHVLQWLKTNHRTA